MKARAKKICEILKRMYPHVRTQLDHRSPFELLIATILSAQCTDKQVNAVTPALFEAFPTPKDMASAPLESLERIIRPTGYYRNKAKNIQQCAQTLIEHYGGNVPNTMEELLKLPGVGRKTANVVLGAAFGIPSMVVDTHVLRISQRLGLTRNSDPAKVEFDLMKIIPKNQWNDFGLRLIYLGRGVCKAIKPNCSDCSLQPWCDFGLNVISSPDSRRDRIYN